MFVSLRLDRSKGVTLVELLVVITMVAILASMALPSYRNMMVAGRVSNLASSLHSTILFARAEALKRGTVLLLCKSSNAEVAVASCDLSPSAGGVGWGCGWILFVDTNQNNQRDPAEILIRVQGRQLSSVSDGSVIPNIPNEFISFNATGQVLTPVNFVIQAGSTSSDQDRAVCIGIGGRAKVGKAPMCT